MKIGIKVDYFDPDLNEDVEGLFQIDGIQVTFTWHDNTVISRGTLHTDEDASWIEWDNTIIDETSMEDILQSYLRDLPREKP